MDRAAVSLSYVDAGSSGNQRGEFARVRIPTQSVSAAFAQLVGVDTFDVSTSAEAVINFASTGGGALPYAITGANGGLLEVCLNNGAGNVPEPLCQGGTTGNFGALDWSLFGNAATTAWGSSGQTTVALPTSCSSSSSPYNSSQRLALNDLSGVDHPLSVVAAACSLRSILRPGSRLVMRQPLQQRDERPGGLRIAGGQHATLALPVDRSRCGCAGASSRSDGSFKAVPSSCVPSTFTFAPSKARMLQCMQDYIVGGYDTVTDANGLKGTVLFGKDTDGDSLNGRVDIMAAPRFGFVPLLWNPTWPTGQSDPVQIRAFRPVYFQTMLLGCNANDCSGVHNPGESWSSINSNKSLDAISALAPPMTMLPREAREIAPAATKDLQITLVR